MKTVARLFVKAETQNFVICEGITHVGILIDFL